MLFLKPNHHHPVYNNYNLKIVSYILLYKRNPKNNTPIFGKYLKKMSAVEPETYVLFTSVLFYTYKFYSALKKWLEKYNFTIFLVIFKTFSIT